jgi:hypothetical protein
MKTSVLLKAAKMIQEVHAKYNVKDEFFIDHVKRRKQNECI